MKFVTFTRGETTAPGLWLDGGRILDLAAAGASDVALDSTSLLSIVRGGAAALDAVRGLSARLHDLEAYIHPRESADRDR